MHIATAKLVDRWILALSIIKVTDVLIIFPKPICKVIEIFMINLHIIKVMICNGKSVHEPCKYTP